MRNVTLAIEEETLRKARVRAVKEGTTVNELIRKYGQITVEPPGNRPSAFECCENPYLTTSGPRTDDTRSLPPVTAN